MDAPKIASLFEDQAILPKFKNKRWVRIQDTNNGNYNSPIKYNCKNMQDKLVDYSQGYIKITGYIASSTATALAAANDVGLQNGSNSVINTATVRFNNSEVDKNHHVYFTTTILNLAEYSPDYASSFAVQYGFAKDTTHKADSDGMTVRNSVVGQGFSAEAGNLPARFEVQLKLPLAYISTFFRRLNFPIMNNLVEIELDCFYTNCILRANDVQASKLTITNSELFLPIIELPATYEARFLEKQNIAFSKQLLWDNLDVYISSNEFQRGEFDFEITPSLPGVRKIFFMAVPADRWFSQTTIFTTSDCAITNYNIVIDSEDFYSQNVSDDIEAYSNISEMLSGGGEDVNTGNLLPFNAWKSVYRLYGADLSRQRVFESDPMKPQSIRLRGTLQREAVGRLRIVVILVQNKTTIIDMVNPFNTKTI